MRISESLSKRILVICFSTIVLSLISILMLSGCTQKVSPVAQQAKLIYILGDVSINDAPAKLGQILQNNSLIKTGKESTAEIRMGTLTGAQIRENSQVKIVQDENGWNVVSQVGAVLSLVQKGTNYHLRSPAAVMAVRGTIFYTHTYNDSTHYVCTCNGTVDIMHDHTTTKTVSAPHHEGYTVMKTASGHRLEPAPMQEHEDVQIFEFMYRLDTAK